MPTKVTAYKCDYCLVKMFNTEEAANIHEKTCLSNPAVRACDSCQHLGESGFCIAPLDNHPLGSCHYWEPIKDRDVYDCINQ